MNLPVGPCKKIMKYINSYHPPPTQLQDIQVELKKSGSTPPNVTPLQSPRAIANEPNNNTPTPGNPTPPSLSTPPPKDDNNVIISIKHVKEYQVFAFLRRVFTLMFRRNLKKTPFIKLKSRKKLRIC